MNTYNLYGDVKAGIVAFLATLPLCPGILARVTGGTIVCAFNGSVLSAQVKNLAKARCLKKK